MPGDDNGLKNAFIFGQAVALTFSFVFSSFFFNSAQNWMFSSPSASIDGVEPPETDGIFQPVPRGMG